MNIVDSSGWLEYFADSANAEFFAPIVKDTKTLLVPSISLFEVFKRVLQQRGAGDALRAVAIMAQGEEIALDATLALEAARLSVAEKLPMADSIILATARTHKATLWTQDADFEGKEGVQFIRKQK